MIRFSIVPPKKDPVGESAKVLRGNLLAAVKDGMLLAESVSKRSYLTGPRPSRLGVVTGRLRSDVKSRAFLSGSKIIGVLGAKVLYARIHESGGVIVPVKANYLKFKIEGRWVFTKKVKIPARPFLHPAVQDALPGIMSKIDRAIKRTEGGR